MLGVDRTAELPGSDDLSGSHLSMYHPLHVYAQERKESLSESEVLWVQQEH